MQDEARIIAGSSLKEKVAERLGMDQPSGLDMVDRRSYKDYEAFLDAAVEAEPENCGNVMKSPHERPKLKPTALSERVRHLIMWTRRKLTQRPQSWQIWILPLTGLLLLSLQIQSSDIPKHWPKRNWILRPQVSFLTR